MVLVADHSVPMTRLIRSELEIQGFRTETAEGDPVDIVKDGNVDIAILDHTSSGSSGLELMARIRRVVDLPVILITSDNARDRITGLEFGADDCLSTPFVPDELGARIRAVLRRAAPPAAEQGIVTVGPGVEIDLVGRVARRDGETIPFTKTEWLIVHYLTLNVGRVLEAQDILRKVWGPEAENDLQYLRVWIARIRRKLEKDDEEILKTVTGVGYILAPYQAEMEVAAAYAE